MESPPPFSAKGCKTFYVDRFYFEWKVAWPYAGIGGTHFAWKVACTPKEEVG